MKSDHQSKPPAALPVIKKLPESPTRAKRQPYVKSDHRSKPPAELPVIKKLPDSKRQPYEKSDHQAKPPPGLPVIKKLPACPGGAKRPVLPPHARLAFN